MSVFLDFQTPEYTVQIEYKSGNEKPIPMEEYGVVINARELPQDAATAAVVIAIMSAKFLKPEWPYRAVWRNCTGPGSFITSDHPAVELAQHIMGLRYTELPKWPNLGMMRECRRILITHPRQFFPEIPQQKTDDRA
jgi:hypothetical protein